MPGFVINPAFSFNKTLNMYKLAIIVSLVLGFALGCGTRYENRKSNDSQQSDTTSMLNDGHNSRNSLDWQGVYKGVTPCADCEGIETTIVLLSDNTFTRKLIYLGKDTGEFSDSGTFEWNEAGSAITLMSAEDQRQMYQVGENTLFHLDQEGKRITGELAEKYTLVKLRSDSQLEGRKWILTVLNGNKIETQESGREAFIQFDATKSSCSGNSSCNNFFGGYELFTDNGIKFGNLAATKMACPGMDTEQIFFDILAKTVAYRVDETRLILMSADQKEIAFFTVAQD